MALHQVRGCLSRRVHPFDGAERFNHSFWTVDTEPRHGPVPGVVPVQAGFPDKCESVLSSSLSQGDFISFLRTALEEHSLAPSKIILELTETYLAKAEEDTLRMIAQMKELGVKIAMDDFGVGYSSLFSLKSIPVDVVKIDRGFVKGITSDLFNATFIRSITDLCHDVGRKVCLEGVETEEEYEAVRELGMEYIQGYYFGRPMSARQFEDRLKE